MSPTGDGKKAGWEVPEIQEPAPGEQSATTHHESGSGNLQGNHSCKEGGRVEDDQRTEPGKEERKALPALEEQRTLEITPKRPQNHSHSKCPKHYTTLFRVKEIFAKKNVNIFKI